MMNAFRSLPDRLRRIAPARVKSLGRRLLDAVNAPSAQRAADPYPTHVPILIGLARLMKIRRVLELGCGVYSTSCFLDRRAFPDLLRLDTFEADPEWAARIAPIVGADSRARLTVTGEPIHRALDRLPQRDYDLIFIDDATAAEERAATIRKIAGPCYGATIVVIHDWEIPLYRRAAKQLPHRFAFDAFNPQTGVAWTGTTLDTRRLRKLNRLIKRSAPQLAADRRADWVEVISHRRATT